MRTKGGTIPDRITTIATVAASCSAVAALIGVSGCDYLTDGSYAVDASAKAGARTVDVSDDPASTHHVKVSSDAGAVSVTSS